MQVEVKLHGVLREILPTAAKGRTQLQVEEGSTVADLLEQLAIRRRVLVAVNDQAETEPAYVLQEGDHITIFTAVSGGAAHHSSSRHF